MKQRLFDRLFASEGGRQAFLISCAVFGLMAASGGIYRLSVARGDPVLVHFSSLGNAFAAHGEASQAMESYQELLEIRPVSPAIEFNFANTLVDRGKIDEAVKHYRQALRLDPYFADAHYNLANLLSARGEISKADAHYQKAAQLRSGFADAHYNRGVLLARSGNGDAALVEFDQTLQIDPAHVEVHFSKALVLLEKKRYGESIDLLELGLELNKDHVNMMDTLAWILSTSPHAELRDGAKAVALARRVCETSGGNNGQHLDTLAAAQAETGGFEEAVQTALKAAQIAQASGNQALASAVDQRIALYRARKAYREQ